ncbi:Putative membrane protein (fragment) [Xanthomonas citri pv. fuscans]
MRVQLTKAQGTQERDTGLAWWHRCFVALLTLLDVFSFGLLRGLRMLLLLCYARSRLIAT